MVLRVVLIVDFGAVLSVVLNLVSNYFIVNSLKCCFNIMYAVYAFYHSEI